MSDRKEYGDAVERVPTGIGICVHRRLSAVKLSALCPSTFVPPAGTRAGTARRTVPTFEGEDGGLKIEDGDAVERVPTFEDRIKGARQNDLCG